MKGSFYAGGAPYILAHFPVLEARLFYQCWLRLIHPGPSWPDLFPAFTQINRHHANKNVDARHRAGHDSHHVVGLRYCSAATARRENCTGGMIRAEVVRAL